MSQAMRYPSAMVVEVEEGGGTAATSCWYYKSTRRDSAGSGPAWTGRKLLQEEGEERGKGIL